jgi:hypothetical protein
MRDKGTRAFFALFFSFLLTTLLFCFLFFLFLYLERLDSAEGEVSGLWLRNGWNTLYLIVFPWNSFVYFCCTENHDGGLKHFRLLPPPPFLKVSLPDFLD